MPDTEQATNARAATSPEVYAYPFRCSTMKDLSPDDRPREKLLRNGPSALGDNELVALVVGIGRARAAQVVAAVELGRRVASRGPSARVQLRSPHDAAAFLLPTFGAR